MLCSCAGSTRASTAVLSQIEATPGAVIAAQAVPEDCGRLPPFGRVFPQQFGGWSACPAGHHGHVGADPCVPERRDRLLDRHAGGAVRLLDWTTRMRRHLAARSWRAGPPLTAGAGRVEASTLSWLQSSLLTSISFMMSASSASGAAVSAAGASASASSAGGVCAGAASIEARLKPAASTAALPSHILSWKSLPARIPDRAENAFVLVQNYGEGAQGALARSVMPSTSSWGW